MLQKGMLSDVLVSWIQILHRSEYRDLQQKSRPADVRSELRQILPILPMHIN
jgi:hypothetical protein